MPDGLTGRAVESGPRRPLDAIRGLHHALARARAQGGSWRDLAAVAGQASGRVWTQGAVERLTESPAFRELVAHYARAV